MTVIVDLAMQDGRWSDFAHDAKACALGQASSSIMAAHVDRHGAGIARPGARPGAPDGERPLADRQMGRCG